MRIVLITHALGPPVRGNGTTVSRWLGSMLERKLDVIAVHPDADVPLDPPPDIVHGYHAGHGGPAARRMATRYDCPLVISVGGTDLFAPEARRESIRAVLEGADLVTGAFPGFEHVLTELTGRRLPYATVRRGVYVEDRAPARPQGERLRVLLPAGLRPVKDPLLAIRMADALRTQGLPIHLRMLGPSLDADCAHAVRAAAAERPFVTLGNLPRVAMGGAYQRADVVWNTSLQEGGANALLEALSYGCAVFARDVPGNRDMLGGPAAPGCLFDPEDLDVCAAFHRDLLGESVMERTRRVAATRVWLREHHDPDREADELEAAYERALRDYKSNTPTTGA